MGSTQTNDNPSVKLAMLPWLQGAPADELETIERNTTARLIPPGKDLCRQGERGWDEAFIIIHGEAAVLVDGQAIARLTDYLADFAREFEKVDVSKALQEA